MITSEAIHRALSLHVPVTGSFAPDRDHAAVALALAGGDRGLSLCFIRRVEKATDPWSGHMAFPGGRADPGDTSARAVAEREAREEVALDLSNARLLGALSDLPVRLGGVDTSMVLSSFVYDVGQSPPTLAPNREEVAEAYWVPLDHLWDQRNAAQLNLARNSESLIFPAIRFEGRLIWGLSLRVLNLFSDVLGRPLPHFEQT
ncbi:MAG TPA: CoA pyrophosphatase [Bryobacteraceae bacterium]|jgi:8-oxo-dGTP pyrophosphatase MutT (NUDIX family)|nr:CoA pyrophosphatase [Bryobacteraceae bacterium]